jgi:hypothetical protein
MASVVTIIERAKIDAINREHRLCEECSHDAVIHAMECGRMLLAVKDDLAHGGWGPWLEKHFEGSDRTARVYMQVAGSPTFADRQTSADLFPTSIAAALKQISTPRPRPASPRDAVGMVGGLEDDDTQAPMTPGRAEQPPQVAWTDQHSRRRVRLVEMLTEAVTSLERASDPGLDPVAIAELLRSAEIKARQASAQLGDLAFNFER